MSSTSENPRRGRKTVGTILKADGRNAKKGIGRGSPFLKPSVPLSRTSPNRPSHSRPECYTRGRNAFPDALNLVIRNSYRAPTIAGLVHLKVAEERRGFRLQCAQHGQRHPSNLQFGPFT